VILSVLRSINVAHLYKPPMSGKLFSVGPACSVRPSR